MRFAPLFASLLLFPALCLGYNEPAPDQSEGKSIDAVLGVNQTFGKWTSTVWLGYDPDGAPALFSDNAKFLDLLNTAIAQWERVSGVDFAVVGVNSNLVDDRDLAPEKRDFTVRVSWSALASAQGQAGATFGYFDPNVGFYSYIDGSVELSNVAGKITSDEQMVRVLVHELGHLLGLGHSDNPVSIMYANPYNALYFPREDDIRAMQTLYGPPAFAIDPSKTFSDWIYSVPTAASSSVTQYLFKPNQQTSKSAYFALSSSGPAITSISSSADDEAFVWLWSGGLGNFNNTSAINLTTQIVITDPYGYVFDKQDWTLQCTATFACGGAGRAIYRVRNLKTVPGTWKIYIVNKADNKLLLTMNLPVQTNIVRNSAPVATFLAQATSIPSSIRFTLAATDAENDTVSVTWHPLLPASGSAQLREVTETIGSSGVVSQTFSFNGVGKKTFFVELKDNKTRYSATAPSGSSGSYGPAGPGYQTLLRITVNLPFTGAADYEVVSTQTEDPKYGGSGTQALSSTELLSVATAPSLSGIVTSDGTSTSAKFAIGASRDRGQTTRTTFTTSDTINIAGLVNVQTADLNKAGAFYVVIRSAASGWLYRDSTGFFRPWDVRIPTLQSTAEVSTLQSSSLVLAYSGKLQAGDYFVYLGYKASGSNTLHYTSAPLRVTVTEQE